MSDLKPCPFCGGKASIGTIEYSINCDIVKLNKQSIFFAVNCIQCGATAKGLIGQGNKEEATKKWNNRVADKPEPITVETFQRMKGYIPYSLYQLIDSINAHFGFKNE